MTTHRRHLLFVFVALAVGACASASGPSTVPAPSPPHVAASSGVGGASPAGPAPSLDPDTPVASVLPNDSGVGGIPDPGRRIVAPKPGQLDVRPIAAETLSANVDGRRVIVSVDYTSGVEPCYVLDSIVVKTGSSAFEITLREGHGSDDVACIEIAEFKRAIVDLGELDPGTYTISDGAGGADPITVTVA
jgi:hypothetical protein